MVKFKIDTSKSADLENALKNSNKNMEGKINEFLHGKGSKAFIQSIIGFMPRSNRNKTHARDSNSLKSVNINLGVEIISKKNFNYLVFPDDGVGKNNKVAQNFSSRGVDKESTNILNKVLEIVVNELEQV